MSQYIFHIYFFIHFLIIFAKSNTQIKPYSLFFASVYDDNNIFLFTENEIHLLYSDFSSYKLLYTFNSTSLSEISTFTKTYNFPDQNDYLIIQKDFDIYLIFPKENKTIIYPDGVKNLIFPYKCDISDINFNCTYFDIYPYKTVDSYFDIFLNQLTNNGKKNLINKVYISSEPIGDVDEFIIKFSCELMGSTKEKNNDLIVYFYEISNKLAVSFIEINSLYDLSSKQLSSKYISNINFYFIKSLLSPNSNNIALLSYISTEDNSLYCLLYNSIEKNFTEPKKIITNCKTNINDFGIVKDTKNKNQNNYLAYCYQNDTQIQYILINETFLENGNEELEGICFNIKDCMKLYTSTVIFLNEKYYLMYSCKNSNGLDITGQKELSESNCLVNTENDNQIIEFENLNGDIITAKINVKKDEIIKALPDVISSIQIGKKYKIKGDDYDINIHPINENLGENTTYVEFLECESKLRSEYNLSPDSILTTLQIEIESKIKNSLTNQVEYAVYDENKIQLDLSVCGDTTIKINYEINNASTLDKNLISSFSDKGIDILDSKNDFFNDVCFPYNENSTDIILSDRISDIYQNYSLCDSNCLYNNINLTLNTIECSCNVKTNISTEEESPNFADMVGKTFKNSNFKVIKCYKTAFTDLSSNIGFIVFALLLVSHIPLFIYYLINGLTPVLNFVSDQMKKNNYIVESKIEKKIVNNPVLKNKRKKSNDKHSRNDNLLNSNMTKKLTKITSDSNVNMLSFKRGTKTKNISKKEKIEDKQKIHRTSSHKNEKNIFKEENFPGYYNLILINLKSKKIERPPSSKFILNYYSYEEAVKYETRDFFRIYLICLLHRQSILHTFFFKSPLEPQSLRICLFIFHYSCDFFMNAFFYLDNKISDRYQYTGDSLYLFSLVNNLVISVCSTLVSFVFRISLKYLINSKSQIENIFREQEAKMRKKKKIEMSINKKNEIIKKIHQIIETLKIKILAFLIIEFCLMLLFTYYITAFCAIYKSTQTSWLSDSFVSFIMSNLFELLVGLIVSILYTTGIKNRLKLMHTISVFIYDIGH